MGSDMPGTRVADVTRIGSGRRKLTTLRRMARGGGRFGLPKEAPGSPDASEFVPLMVEVEPCAYPKLPRPYGAAHRAGHECGPPDC